MSRAGREAAARAVRYVCSAAEALQRSLLPEMSFVVADCSTAWANVSSPAVVSSLMEGRPCKGRTVRLCRRVLCRRVSEHMVSRLPGGAGCLDCCMILQTQTCTTLKSLQTRQVDTVHDLDDVLSGIDVGCLAHTRVR